MENQAVYVIWDFDGTLIDTYGAIVAAFVDALGELGIKDITNDRIYELVKVDTKHCAEILGREKGLEPEKLRSRARSIYDNIAEVVQKPIPFAESICNEILDRNGKNLIVTHRDRASTIDLLEKHRLLSLFSEIVTADDKFPEKPSPDSFNYLLEKYELNTGSVVGVGDRDLDVHAANHAGITSVFFCPEGEIHPSASHSILCMSELRALIT